MAPTALLPTDEKTLRENFIRDEDERSKVAYNEFSNEVPVISLGCIDKPDGRSDVRKKIVEACEDWGICQVVDHGVDPGLVADMTRLAKEFFAPPAADNLRYDISGGKKGGFIVSRLLKGEAVQDRREIVMFLSYPIRTRDNTRWPEKPAGWMEVAKKYSDSLMGLEKESPDQSICADGAENGGELLPEIPEISLSVSSGTRIRVPLACYYKTRLEACPLPKKRGKT